MHQSSRAEGPTRNFLTFMNTTVIAYHQKPEALTDFFCPYAIAVVFTNVRNLRVQLQKQPQDWVYTPVRHPSIHPSIERVFRDMHHTRRTNIPPTALSSSVEACPDRVWCEWGGSGAGIYWHQESSSSEVDYLPYKISPVDCIYKYCAGFHCFTHTVLPRGVNSAVVSGQLRYVCMLLVYQ